MVRTAPPPGERARTRRPPEAVGLALRQTVDTAAARLAEAGAEVELHPLVANERGGPVVTTYALALALGSVLALAWPMRASALLGLLLVCGLLDLEGRRSWFRRLAPREGGRALVHWSARGAEPGPVVLLVVPDEATRPRAPGIAASVLAALTLLGVVGALSRPFVADMAAPLLVAVAVCAVVLAFLAWGMDRRGRLEPDAESGLRLSERLVAALDDAPPARGRVAVATIGGGTLFHDGIDVLLRNHGARLTPGRTRVLTWQPGDGPLSLVPRDGRLLRSRAPDPLLGALAPLDLPVSKGVTTAARARACGWPAVGLQGGLDDPAGVVRALAAAARHTAEAP